jgi:hypothetical protein
MTGRLLAGIAVGVLGVAALAGCGSDSSAGGSGATTTAAAPAWSPCTGLSDATLRAAGLDPATKKTGFYGEQPGNWQVCDWKPFGFDVAGATGYSIGIFSTNDRTVDDVRHASQTSQLVDVTIGGRPAAQYHFGADNPALSCDLAFRTASNGMVFLSAEGSTAGEYTESLCSVVRKVATALLPELPK